MCGIDKRRFVFNDKWLPPIRRPSESANCKRLRQARLRAEQLNADLEARVVRLESILRRGLDREAAIDLNAMLRTHEFPPLDLGTDGVAAPRPIWYEPPEPGPIAGFFGAKSRHEQRLAAAREKFERAELEYERAEVARQERIREHTSRYEAALLAYQNDIARHNSRIAQISAGVQERDRESVQYYLELALAGTLFPEDVPHAAEVGLLAARRAGCRTFRAAVD
jgi:hypothetical protein